MRMRRPPVFNDDAHSIPEVLSLSASCGEHIGSGRRIAIRRASYTAYIRPSAILRPNISTEMVEVIVGLRATTRESSGKMVSRDFCCDTSSLVRVDEAHSPCGVGIDGRHLTRIV